MPQRTRPRRRRQTRRPILPWLLTALLVILGGKLLSDTVFPILKVQQLENVETPDWIDVQLIDIDGHSRRGEKLKAVRDIVIHYVGNPGTTAQANRDYFAGSDSTVSAHFVVGLDGEIIQCVPLSEKSSASNDRNGDTISIEVCHPDETGKFNEAAYNALVKLTAWLLDQCGLKSNHIIRHYDVTGKLCPLYFVEHEDAWVQFQKDVKYYRPQASVSDKSIPTRKES